MGKQLNGKKSKKLVGGITIEDYLQVVVAIRMEEEILGTVQLSEQLSWRSRRLLICSDCRI